ncbi:MAG: SPOR domain-containing protein [Bacteroidota bacterium]
MNRTLLFLTVIVAFYSCKPTSSVVTTKYEEDLSVYRDSLIAEYQREEDQEELSDENKPDNQPEASVNMQSLDVTQKIDDLIDTLNILGQSRKFVQGYTVQVYNGRNREDAFKAKERVYSLELGFEPEVVYVQPNFKVKIGQYLERIEARRVQNKLAVEFNTAIVIPDRIYIK